MGTEASGTREMEDFSSKTPRGNSAQRQMEGHCRSLILYFMTVVMRPRGDPSESEICPGRESPEWKTCRQAGVNQGPSEGPLSSHGEGKES